jgi:hypothetical protein
MKFYDVHFYLKLHDYVVALEAESLEAAKNNLKENILNNIEFYFKRAIETNKEHLDCVEVQITDAIEI